MYKEVSKNNKLYKFYNENNLYEVMYIFKSSFIGYYICITQDGEYDDSNMEELTAKQIKEKYNIDKFTIIERFDKISSINDKHQEKFE